MRVEFELASLSDRILNSFCLADNRGQWAQGAPNFAKSWLARLQREQLRRDSGAPSASFFTLPAISKAEVHEVLIRFERAFAALTFLEKASLHEHRDDLAMEQRTGAELCTRIIAAIGESVRPPAGVA